MLCNFIGNAKCSSCRSCQNKISDKLLMKKADFVYSGVYDIYHADDISARIAANGGVMVMIDEKGETNGNVENIAVQTVTSSQATEKNENGKTMTIVKPTENDVDSDDKSDTSAFESDSQVEPTNGNVAESNPKVPVPNVDDNVINILPEGSMMDTSTGKIILSNATALVKGNEATEELTDEVVDKVCQFLEAEPIELFLCNVPQQQTDKMTDEALVLGKDEQSENLTKDATKDDDVDETLNGDDESPSKKIRLDESDKQVEVSQVGDKYKVVCKFIFS